MAKNEPSTKQSKQLALPLPKGFKIEWVGEELRITRRWFWSHPGQIAVLLGGIAGIGVCGFLIYTLPSMEMTWGQSLLCLVPLGGGMAGLIYLIMSTLFNRTTVVVNPKTLTIRHGPLPAPGWRGMQFEAHEIKQLYVTEQINSSPGEQTYRYQLCLLTTKGKHITLMPEYPFSRWAEPLFLEQEIERGLGLPDRSMSEEPPHSASLDLLDKLGQTAWQQLAAANHLDFIKRSPLKGAYIVGCYRGYSLELDILTKERGDTESVSTRLLISAQSEPDPKSVVKPDSIGEIPADLVESPVLAEVATLLKGEAGSRLKGHLTIEAGGQQLYYEQPGIEIERNYLQFLIETCSDLLAAYPKIVALGGLAVPDLEASLNQKKHLLHATAPQLLAEIAEDTTRRLAELAPRLLCSRCLGRCGTHEIQDSRLRSLSYYGCQACGQSQTFFEFEGQVTAVLDRQMTTGQIQAGSDLRVNWLARRNLFCFDEVEIIQAEDEEVELFAVQVGNDTNPARQAGYRQMRCLVSSGCALTENTLRILRYTFGELVID